jgi:hypothetical protein
LVIARNPLAFLDQVHQLNAWQSGSGRTKGFEAEHGSDDPFDGPVVLLDEIVQILALADLDFVAGFLLECLESRGIGATLAIVTLSGRPC